MDNQIIQPSMRQSKYRGHKLQPKYIGLTTEDLVKKIARSTKRVRIIKEIRNRMRIVRCPTMSLTMTIPTTAPARGTGMDGGTRWPSTLGGLGQKDKSDRVKLP